MVRVKESEILTAIMTELKKQKFFRRVIWFTRLNSGTVRTEYGSWLHLCEAGTPDVMALIHDGNDTHVLFIECKRPGGKMSGNQLKFRDSVKGFRDIHHLEVSDVDTLKLFLSDLTAAKTQREIDAITI